MKPVIAIENVSKHYGSVTALDQVSFTLEENQIYGLLGRNGAGKTTLMHLLTAQIFPTQGNIRIFGEEPFENYNVLQKICFIKESQAFLKTITVQNTLNSAARLYPNWDAMYAEQLLKQFNLPPKRKVKQLSRGMLSSLGIIIGLASRAPLTIFDEPYLGLDAASRTLFYNLLLTDFAEHPRTVILSTHLIDEVSKLLNRVLIMDRGRLILNEDTESMHYMAFTITGAKDRVEHFASGRRIIHREQLGGTSTLTILGELDRNVRSDAAQLNLSVDTVSLQQLMIYLTAAPLEPHATIDLRKEIRR